MSDRNKANFRPGPLIDIPIAGLSLRLGNIMPPLKRNDASNTEFTLLTIDLLLEVRETPFPGALHPF